MNLQTKQDFTALAMRFLSPLLPLYSPGGALLHLGDTGATYPQRTIGMEAFSRPLWALAPLWAGGGRADAFLPIYQRGLVNGTDPDSPEYWGDPNDYDQLFVEMAALACAILETPESVWNPLTDTEKAKLGKWLDTINHHDLPGCNWLLFRVLVNLALDSVGMPCSMQQAAADMAEVDKWYVGDGWYSDGPAEVKPQKDYYNPWAIQYYTVLYSVFAARRDPARAALYRERAVQFGRQFAQWFDPDGAALPFGRSLGYRIGQSAFYAACIWAGLEPLPLPVMKGIIVRNLAWWLARPIFDRDGVLTIGYGYPQMYMAEQYNAPGSPYWGMKSFLLLALPDDHPFWSAEAAPMPALERLKPMPYANMLVQRRAGRVTAYAAGVNEGHGHGQFPEKYAKFAYDTRFGFCASRSREVLNQAAPDSMLAFVIDDNVFVRKVSKTWEIEAGAVTAQWSPFPGIEVTTTITPTATGHRRHHEIDSSFDCEAYDCGFAVPNFTPGYAESAENDTAEAHCDTLCCAVRGRGEAVVIGCDPNTSLYFTNVHLPAVKYHIPKGHTVLDTEVFDEAN